MYLEYIPFPTYTLLLTKNMYNPNIHTQTHQYTDTNLLKSIQRHSKSIDVTKKGCGKCGGFFKVQVLDQKTGQPKKARKLTPYNVFVKKHYSSVFSRLKEEQDRGGVGARTLEGGAQGVTQHKSVQGMCMKELSVEWKKKSALEKKIYAVE